MTKRILSCSLVLVASGLMAACFNTKDIQSGGLKCAPSADPTVPGVCPDDFFCGEGHLCYRDGSEGVALCQLSEAQKPYGPFAACAPPSQSISLCDPVCQSGCSCAHRCSMVGDFDTGYSFACQAPPSAPLLDTFFPCDVAKDKDACMPGRVCLPPPSDSEGCGPRCERYCRRDEDCPERSRCIFTIDVGGGKAPMFICSPPAVLCNPVQIGGATACAASPTGNTCYVFSASSPDETMCDCAGTIKAGAPCQGQHSCTAGHECVAGTCQRLCLLAVGGTGCGAGQTCVAYANSTKFGICQ